MSRECASCGFRADDDASFERHMSSTHGWGAATGATPPADAIARRLPSEETSVPKFCGSCGAPRDSASTNFCRHCGAPFAGASTVSPEASLAFAPKGGFWRRVTAYLLDGVILAVVGFLLGIVVGIAGVALRMRDGDITVVAQLLGELLGIGYFMFFWSARGSGQTPGMRALGLRVIRTDGTYMSVGRAFLRNVAFGISTLALGIGLIWVAFDENKQGWHDKIADTYVVRTA